MCAGLVLPELMMAPRGLMPSSTFPISHFEFRISHFF